MAEEEKLHQGRHVANDRVITTIIDKGPQATYTQSHRGGSFNKYTDTLTTQFDVENRQEQVGKDKYLTVNNSNNTAVGGDDHHSVSGNHIVTVGKFLYEKYKQWKDTYLAVHNERQKFNVRRTAKEDDNTYLADGQTQEGTRAQFPVTTQDQYFSVRTSSIYANGVGITTSQNTGNVTIPPEEYERAAGAEGANTWIGGQLGISSSESPSTQDGEWTQEPNKEEMSDMLVKLQEELTSIENEIGTGGNEHIYIAKNLKINVGAEINDLQALKVDPHGRLGINQVLIGTSGVFDDKKERPYIQPVDTSRFPCGTTSIIGGNMLEVKIGSGGISLESFTGPVDINGGITNIGGQQVNVSSANDINISSGNALSIEASTLSLKNTSGNQVVVEGSLGTTKNLTVGGGAHIEGEIFVNHITAPFELQETFDQYTNGAAGSYGICFTPMGTFPVYVYPHTHTFLNAPMTLVDGNDSLRDSSHSTGMNGTERVQASAPSHGQKEVAQSNSSSSESSSDYSGYIVS
jgi:hypothetical protein